MDKIRMKSPVVTAQNIAKIGALFSNCVTETVDKRGKPAIISIGKRKSIVCETWNNGGGKSYCI